MLDQDFSIHHEAHKGHEERTTGLEKQPDFNSGKHDEICERRGHSQANRKFLKTKQAVLVQLTLCVKQIEPIIK